MYLTRNSTIKLNIEYPVLSSTKKQIALAFVIGFWLFLFLFFAEPFKIDKFSFSKKLIVLPLYGIIQAVIISLALTYQKWILKKAGRWKLMNELAYHLIVVLSAWGLNYTFYISFVTSGENTYSFLEFTRYHFFPAILIVLPVLALIRFLTGFYGTPSKEAIEESIVFKGNGVRDYLKIRMQDLLYVMAEGNYINVFYYENGSTNSKLIRSRMNEVEDSKPLLKVHRSYLVNPQHIQEYHYKSKNLYITLTGGCSVPVSRAKKREVLSHLQEG